MRLFSIFLLAVLVSCQANRKEKNELEKVWEPPIVSYPLQQCTYIDSTIQFESSMRILGIYPDTIGKIEIISQKELRIRNMCGSANDSTDLISPDSCIIFVDPNQEFIQEYDVYQLRFLEEEDGRLETFNFFERTYRHPVFIRNTSSTAKLIFKHEGKLVAIQEAQNQQQEWIPIEIFAFTGCGNSDGIEQIGANGFLLSSIEKYQGSFETKLRVKLVSHNDTIYSNEFIGRINPEQLENRGELLGMESYLR